MTNEEADKCQNWRGMDGAAGRLSFPEFCRCFGWRDPKNALIYVNPSAADLAGKL